MAPCLAQRAVQDDAHDPDPLGPVPVRACAHGRGKNTFHFYWPFFFFILSCRLYLGAVAVVLALQTAFFAAVHHMVSPAADVAPYTLADVRGPVDVASRFFPNHPLGPRQIPPQVYVLALAWCPCIVAINELVRPRARDMHGRGAGHQNFYNNIFVFICYFWQLRRKDAAYDVRNQKRAKLIFETKLGMHSPK